MSNTISDTISHNVEQSVTTGHISTIFNLFVNDLKTIKDTLVASFKGKTRCKISKGDVIQIKYEIAPYNIWSVVGCVKEVENERLIIYKNLRNGKMEDLFYDEIIEINVIIPNNLKKDITKRREIPIELIEDYIRSNKFDE